MGNEGFGLAINNDVIARMAEMAALETEGVAAMGVKPVDLKSVLGKKGSTRAVTVSTEHGIISVVLYIKVRDTANVGEVAEKVQAGVKDKIQGMTGNAVTRVNVVISDVEFTDEAVQEAE